MRNDVEYLLGKLEALRGAHLDQSKQSRVAEQQAAKWVHNRICALLSEFENAKRGLHAAGFRHETRCKIGAGNYP
jgi:hypothetical protein